MAEKKPDGSDCFCTADFMAARQAVAVIITFGRAFCRIQAISSLVSAGDTSVAVRPDAKTPKRMGAKGKQLGSWIRTTGAISGPCGQEGVGGSLRICLGSRPRARREAATDRASLEIWPKVRARSVAAVRKR